MKRKKKVKSERCECRAELYSDGKDLPEYGVPGRVGKEID